MVTELAEGALIIAPLFLGFIVHGLCIRLGALRGLARPIKRTWFGENQTYRGVVCVALGTAVGLVVIDPPFLSQGSEHRTQSWRCLVCSLALPPCWRNCPTAS